jgi:dihydroorotate dehydrogenase
LQLLTRAECGLCEEFEAQLAAFAATSGLSLPPLQRIDVDAHPELARRYGLDIPVLLWGGVKVCEHRLDEAELRRLLRPR